MTTHTLIAIALAATACTVHAGDVKLETLPAAVQETIRSNARGATVSDIDVLVVDGRTLYVSEVDLPGDKDLDIHVSAEGKLLKTSEDVELSEVPAPVREGIKKLEAGGGTVEDIDKEVADGKTTYHLDLDRTNAPDLDVILAEDGSVISQVEDR